MGVMMAICEPGGVEILLLVKMLKSPGISYDGGYADYMIAPVKDLSSKSLNNLRAREVAPLMCAGITTYNALRNTRRARRGM